MPGKRQRALLARAVESANGRVMARNFDEKRTAEVLVRRGVLVGPFRGVYTVNPRLSDAEARRLADLA